MKRANRGREVPARCRAGRLLGTVKAHHLDEGVHVTRRATAASSRTTTEVLRTAVTVAAAAGLTLSLAACGSDDSGGSGGSGRTSAQPSASEKSMSGKQRVPQPAKDTQLAKLPSQLAADGRTVVVGEADAKNTVSVYEDPRCPFCKQFELTNGHQLAEAAEKGGLKIEYTLASFLDDRLGGHGSKRAANALRASVEKKKFPQFHALLYQNQPTETRDGFTNERLLDLASKIKGLRGPSFDKAVKDNKYGDWVAASQKAYEKAKVGGTPAMKLNGRKVPNKTLMAPKRMAKLLRKTGATI